MYASPTIIGPAIPVSIGRTINIPAPINPIDNLGMPITTLKINPKRVIQAREALGWNTPELARRAGLSQPSVWAIEEGVTKEPKLSTIQKIAAATGKPLLFFTDLTDYNTDTDVHLLNRKIPLVSWVLAGAKNPVSDPFLPGEAEDWEDVTVSVSKATFALRVRGDSMIAPDGTGFPENTIIIVDPEVQAKNGDYVVVRFENSDEATFKRLVVDGPAKFLRALNPAYPSILVTDDARLCGVVVESNIRRKFR
jgi:SOS-response transcriptional repressor LexA